MTSHWVHRLSFQDDSGDDAWSTQTEFDNATSLRRENSANNRSARCITGNPNLTTDQLHTLRRHVSNHWPLGQWLSDSSCFRPTYCKHVHGFVTLREHLRGTRGTHNEEMLLIIAEFNNAFYHDELPLAYPIRVPLPGENKSWHKDTGIERSQPPRSQTSGVRKRRPASEKIASRLSAFSSLDDNHENCFPDISTSSFNTMDGKSTKTLPKRSTSSSNSISSLLHEEIQPRNGCSSSSAFFHDFLPRSGDNESCPFRDHDNFFQGSAINQWPLNLNGDASDPKSLDSLPPEDSMTGILPPALPLFEKPSVVSAEPEPSLPRASKMTNTTKGDAFHSSTRSWITDTPSAMYKTFAASLPSHILETTTKGIFDLLFWDSNPFIPSYNPTLRLSDFKNDLHDELRIPEDYEALFAREGHALVDMNYFPANVDLQNSSSRLAAPSINPSSSNIRDSNTQFEELYATELSTFFDGHDEIFCHLPKTQPSVNDWTAEDDAALAIEFEGLVAKENGKGKEAVHQDDVCIVLDDSAG